ncbi:acid protease [Fomitopsis serialis]|uniref:acid protease n=1 Tax=Fomitopsis serialis TaxID=139415 RepID=UPI002008E6C6|nr:acid protease [Neoantrodia serialis]KAH9936082.1 acid protease [Neoantrodia serialis]
MSHVVVRSVPFSTRLSVGSAKELVARDKARAQKLLAGVRPHGPLAYHEERQKRSAARHHHHGGGSTGTGTGSTGTGTGTGTSGTTPSSGGVGVDVTDAGVTYTASVGIGSPATNYTLLIDTGSSNTWTGASAQYTQTSTSKSTGNTVNVSYGSGSFSGTEYTDTVTLGTGLTIQNQSIGVASTAQGFQGVDGILGIGPVDLTSNTVSNTPPCHRHGQPLRSGHDYDRVDRHFLRPHHQRDSGTANGELTFGGVDSTKYTGDITYTPITTTSPASNYWGINQDVTYGQNGTSLLSGNAGIVDTGTTLLMIATDAFQKYQKATGATLDSTTGLLSITEDQYNKLQSLYFKIGSTTFEFTANAQIWPRSLNSTLGGEAGKIYLITSDLGSNSGQGLDFINGFAWLQRYYSVFDTTNKQVGLATTQYTDATSN